MVTAEVEGDEGELWLALVLVLVVEGGGTVHSRYAKVFHPALLFVRRG